MGVQSWLAERGVSRTLAEAYRKSGWLERIGRGAYVQAGDPPNWLGAVFSLQRHLHLTGHPAAKTALELKGRAHFLSLGRGATVWLFADSGEKLPAWFRQRKWDVKVRFTTTNLFSATLNLGFTQHDAGGYEVNISAPERAAMELLHLVPQEQSYEEAKLLFEGLTTLRPKLVQERLQPCSSVKVKRLFMFLAEALDFWWVRKLDLSQIDFGRGKRVVVKGGNLDTRYQISVPDVREGNAEPLVSA